MNGRHVRKGREKELLRMSSRLAVGKTGKGPAPVSAGLARAALGVVESDDEGSGNSGNAELGDRGEWRF